MAERARIVRPNIARRRFADEQAEVVIEETTTRRSHNNPRQHRPPGGYTSPTRDDYGLDAPPPPRPAPQQRRNRAPQIIEVEAPPPPRPSQQRRRRNRPQIVDEKDEIFIVERPAKKSKVPVPKGARYIAHPRYTQAGSKPKDVPVKVPKFLGTGNDLTVGRDRGGRLFLTRTRTLAGKPPSVLRPPPDDDSNSS